MLKTFISLSILIGAFSTPFLNDIDIHFNKGMNFYKSYVYDSAIIEFTNCINLDSNFADAWFYRAQSKDRLPIKDTNNLKSAIEDYSVSIRLKPNPIAYNNRGQDKAILGDPDAAILDYQAAVNLDSTYGPGYYNLASAIYNKGKYKEACSLWIKAKMLNPKLTPIVDEQLKTYCE